MKPPVFIIGAPRSGTTLTAKILGAHPSIYIAGEGYFFDDIYSMRKESGELSNPDSLDQIYRRLMTMYGRYNMPQDQERVNSLRENVLSISAFKECKSYKDILNIFMEKQTELEGKSRWGNHTPRDLYNIDDILSFYPDCKIIACVRDPRDFMLSYKGKWKMRKGNEALRLKQLYHPVITSLLWKSSMKKVIALNDIVPEGNLFILKYEDLVAKPEIAVNRLCHFLGESFHSFMLNVSGNNSSNLASNSRGIFSTSVGRWKKQLSAVDAEIMQKLAANEMNWAGYNLDNINCSTFKIAGYFFTAPFAVVRGLYLSRHKRGPLLPYLLRRLKPFFRCS